MSSDRSKYYLPSSTITSARHYEPEGVFLSEWFPTYRERIKNFKLRADDVWVVTFPKCGTTWTQEMTWQILHGYDPEGGKVNLDERSPFLEFSMFLPDDLKTAMPGLKQSDYDRLENFKKVFDKLESMESPRLIKTHLPFEYLPVDLVNKCKVIYVARNAKDACVSYYHHEKLIPVHGLRPELDFNTYCQELFMTGEVVFGDYWHHLECGLNFKSHSNVKFVWYEDMKADLGLVIKEVATWLGKPLADDKVALLEKDLGFDRIQQNEAVNKKSLKKPTGGQFMRKGVVGDWVNHFSGETESRFDAWAEKKLAEMGMAGNKMARRAIGKREE